MVIIMNNTFKRISNYIIIALRNNHDSCENHDPGVDGYDDDNETGMRGRMGMVI